jgi:hypothetical protein
MAACAEVVMIDTKKLGEQVAEAIRAKRYGRAISSMTPRNRFVHDILVEYYDHPSMRGSWGSGHTMLSRLIEHGPMGAAQPGSTAPMELPARLLLVRDAVNHLNSRMHTVIEMTYGANFPVEVIARRIHESHAVTRDILKDARPLIAAFLAGRGIMVPKDSC